MHLFFVELWAWGLPQAAMALATAGALGFATIVILNRRGPKNRLAREDAAYAWACLYVAAGTGSWLMLGWVWLNASPSSTMGIAVAIGVIVAIPLSAVWHVQLSILGAAARRLGARSMHILMAAMSLAGVAAAVATPLVIIMLIRAGLLNEGDVIPVLLGVIPLGSAIAGLAVAPFLPIGSHAKGRCMRCGYDLSGLAPTVKTGGALRCPECGYHPSA